MAAPSHRRQIRAGYAARRGWHKHGGHDPEAPAFGNPSPARHCANRGLQLPPEGEFPKTRFLTPAPDRFRVLSSNWPPIPHQTLCANKHRGVWRLVDPQNPSPWRLEAENRHWWQPPLSATPCRRTGEPVAEGGEGGAWRADVRPPSFPLPLPEAPGSQKYPRPSAPGG
jgi:hypothetical protein